MRRLWPALFVVALLAVPASAATTDPGFSLQWGLKTVQAEAAWTVGTGKGTVIAAVDSGVDRVHEDLAGKLVPGYDFIDDDADPTDRNGHGSHVAGIAAAITDNGVGVAGVARGAKIMPVRVLNEDGTSSCDCSSDPVVAGIRWAADRGADVINLSLGDVLQGGVAGINFGPSFSSALTYAWSKGAIPVVSAGNDYLLSSGYSDDDAIVVSATDRNDEAPSYASGVGSAKWGMSAPGGGDGSTSEWIFSTYWAAGKKNSYAYARGSSMAAPHVAGAAAVLRSLGVGQRETVNLLLSTATDLGPAGRDSTFGAGRLNLKAAVAAATGSEPEAPSAPPSAPPAAATTDPTGRASAPADAPAARSGSTAGTPAPPGAGGDEPSFSAVEAPVPAVEDVEAAPPGDTPASSRAGIVAAVVAAAVAACGGTAFALARARRRR